MKFQGELDLSRGLQGFLTLTRIDVKVGVYRIKARVKEKMKDLGLNCEKIIFTGDFKSKIVEHVVSTALQWLLRNAIKNL